MDIKTAADISQDALVQLRKGSGLTQKEFWRRLGFTQSAGCRYEKDEGKVPPQYVRLLVFAQYVAGIDLDSTTDESASRIIQLGRKLQAEQHKQQAEKHLSVAKKLLNDV